jgi:hypothetical protein
MTTRIKFRRDTSGNWTSADPILADGEPGLETDTRKLKYGNGTSTWTVLPYASGGVEIGEGGEIQIGRFTSNVSNWDVNSIAIGTDAGKIDQSTAAVAIGHGAGNENQDRSAVAIGRSAGQTDQGRSSIAIGRYAAANDQSEEAIAIGYNAGNTQQRYHAIAIGANAGDYQQSYSAVAIGNQAGETSQHTTAVAIGSGAGNYQQQYNAVAIGAYAGNEGQGQNSVAVGHEAGNSGQGWAAVAVGENAGDTNQGFRAIAIGRWAGDQYQGNQAVAIGALAGRYYQNDYAVAVGRHAGESAQGEYAIAIGQEAGRGSSPNTTESYFSANWVSGGQSGSSTFVVNTVSGIIVGMQAVGNNLNNTYVTAVNTQTYEVTINPGTSGDVSGTINFYGHQGDYAIAIGAYASARHQHDNSVVINATGAEVLSAGTGTVVIKTVRAVTTSSGFFPCYYNPTTGELVYLAP